MEREPRGRRVATLLAQIDAGLESLKGPEGSLMQQRASQKRLAYAPWSRSCFSRRLATFWAFPCHNLHSPVNAVAWAKRGWVCAGRTSLYCEGCQRKLELDVCGMEKSVEKEESGVYLSRTIDSDLKLSLNSYLDFSLIEKGHAEGCSWRRRACDESIMKLPLSDRYKALEAYNARVQALRTIHTQHPLPLLNLPLELQQKVENMELKEDFDKVEKLSLFGWTSVIVDSVPLLTCMACHRRIGLWAFESSQKETFDVVHEHRDYCPWINSQSQVSLIPGWKLLNQWINYDTKKEETSTDNHKNSLDVRLDHLREIFGLKTVSIGSKSSI
ncbi:hypothetical protein PORY_001479 [Pneumocystis oryctolagi]|uniref:Uncharacterized protein n=1 Tax=Pneumocystis oryctolagi TaxID=42067 RepID=A0ACB7CEJ7_9ASCO|nr:hypothetical protein PORY_001479 [Pneumocystis oryctolagi]